MMDVAHERFHGSELVTTIEHYLGRLRSHADDGRVANGLFRAMYVLQETASGYDWRTEPPIDVIGPELAAQFGGTT